MDRKREIYTRIEKVENIVEILKVIKTNEKEVKHLFSLYDKLKIEEDKLFENWSFYLEDIVQKLDHVTL
ncbi:MAG: hypothetical protein PF569_00785 [Candidatus Woesearchaeota archaeon]|jgi:hypothetical protein|nr:hypothetical protein [Candidatus Woesearchaeota archaeon]